jgi:ABC-type xylose transport system permease subunit
MRHVVVVGIVGFVAGSAGAITAITVADLGPDWYPIALALTAFPCVWLGGVLHGVRHWSAGARDSSNSKQRGLE